MAKKPKSFTVVIVPNSQGKVRRITIPRFLITTAAIGLIICSFVLFYFVGEYKIVKEKLASFKNLQRLTQVQQEKIVSLNRKVAQFGETLNKLEEMEKRIKAMAGGGGRSEGISEDLRGDVQDKYNKYKLLDSFTPGQIMANSLKVIDKMENELNFLKNKASLQKRNLARIEELIKNKKALFACTPNIFPVKGWISAGYGVRINPFSGRKERHEAIDIVASWGEPVIAACRGKVVLAGWKDFYGLMIRVENEYGYSTVYAHLSKILVEKGQRVKKGQVIGKVGSSGRSTGPHLHFEVWEGDETVDPLKLMVEPLGWG